MIKVALAVCVLIFLVGCGGVERTPISKQRLSRDSSQLAGNSTISITVFRPNRPTRPILTVPLVEHVFVIVEENHDYGSVVGNPSMPYLNQLANQYGLATEYYANTHPSIGNYFMLTTGQIITNDDAFSGTVTDDNVVRELIAAGKSWRSYAEDLPSVGYLGDDVNAYVKHHNPFAYLSDVRDNSAEAQHIVPFSQFASDLANSSLPSYAFIIPNLNHDAHDGSLAQADQWLSSNISSLLSSDTFQKSGLLIVVFDESETDNNYGGGKVPMIIVSPLARSGFRSTKLYQHQSVLRLSLEALGVFNYPGAAATAPEMNEFF